MKSTDVPFSPIHWYVNTTEQVSSGADKGVVIFPFINQMIEELGVTDNPDRVGFYSGLVVSVSSLSTSPCRS